jgi:hypothetical protein
MFGHRVVGDVGNMTGGKTGGTTGATVTGATTGATEVTTGATVTGVATGATATGVALGPTLGSLDTVTVGKIVGATVVGKTFGVALGDPLGTLLGVPLGFVLGRSLGKSLGVSLGESLGGAEWSHVGSLVGFCDGIKLMAVSMTEASSASSANLNRSGPSNLALIIISLTETISFKVDCAEFVARSLRGKEATSSLPLISWTRSAAKAMLMYIDQNIVD